MNEFEKLTDYFIRENHIDINERYEVTKISARHLICANRFDLMAKWIYIDAYEKHVDMGYAVSVYKDSINAFSCGRFTEPGTDSKNSFDKYINQFNALIEDIKSNGFDESISLVPVGKGDVLLDGAHRVAVAAYYNKEISIIRFPELHREFDYRYFRKYLMSDINMDYMADTYAHIMSHCFMACIWPVAGRDKIDQITDLICSFGPVVYEQDVYLTYRGLCTFMAQIYGHQAWVGNIENKFSGVQGKATCCYNKKHPIHTYLFRADSLDAVLNLKSKIRSLFDLGNHSVHISDSDEETRMMTELLYNPNTVQFMNLADPFKYSMVYSKISDLKDFIRRNGMDINRFIIDSSSVLEVCGLRAARDVDYLTDCVFDNTEQAQGDGIDNHKSQLSYHQIAIEDMLYNPQNHFYFAGMKFISINRLIEMKRNRGEKKDKKDIKLLRDFSKNENHIPKQYRYSFMEKKHKEFVQDGLYGEGDMSYREYVARSIKKKLRLTRKLYHIVKSVLGGSFLIHIEYKLALILRQNHVRRMRKRLKNKDFSLISSNCNGGVVCSDLGVPFNSPFVNLFIKADDFVKLCSNLKQYMESELVFTDEVDSIYGKVEYPTAYLNDVKIYFMHYKSEKEAQEAWERRKARINWDNLWFMFTDRSGCTQEDMEVFDRLPLEHKVVFTHLPHPEIESSVYIRGYENQDKIGIITMYSNNRFPIKRVIEQFDYVKWLNNMG